MSSPRFERSLRVMLALVAYAATLSAQTQTQMQIQMQTQTMGYGADITLDGAKKAAAAAIAEVRQNN